MEAGFCPEGQYGEVRLREIYETKDGKGGIFFFKLASSCTDRGWDLSRATSLVPIVSGNGFVITHSRAFRLICQPRAFDKSK